MYCCVESRRISILLSIQFCLQRLTKLFPQSLLLSLESAVQTGDAVDESGVAEAFPVRNIDGTLHIFHHGLYLVQGAGDRVGSLSAEGDTLAADLSDLGRDPDELFGLGRGLDELFGLVVQVLVARR